MSSDSSSVESLYLSESESDSGKVSDPPMSDSDLIEPKKKMEEEIPDTNEDDEDDEKPKRRRRRHHDATGRPRGVIKGSTKLILTGNHFPPSTSGRPRTVFARRNVCCLLPRNASSAMHAGHTSLRNWRGFVLNRCRPWTKPAWKGSGNSLDREWPSFLL